MQSPPPLHETHVGQGNPRKHRAPLERAARSHAVAPVREVCTLAIVGGGYAGICALNAAAEYLKPGDRVIVVDAGRQWGGQWVDQYDFVRLHQPFSVFTAGSREWAIKGSKEPGHLANKKEILAHFDDIIQACVREGQLELVPLFGYKYSGHEIVHGKVNFTVHWCESENNHNEHLKPPREVHITADRMIKGMGLQVPIKKPFVLPTRNIVSVCPADILKPAWNAYMRNEGKDKPIYFVGSGKTAMDCMYHLCKDDPQSVYKNRMHCLAGRGMQFFNRDKLFPQDFWTRNMYGTSLQTDLILPMLSKWNGKNAQECYAYARSISLMHSPIPDPENFVLGILSVEETKLIKKVLSPSKEKVFKAHLLNAIDDPADSRFALLKLRACSGPDKGQIYYHRVPAGTVLVNCTDSLLTQEVVDTWEPLVSDGGLVLSPQAAIGFSGPSANVMTHLWYTGGLDGGIWRKLLRAYPTADNKENYGLCMAAISMLNQFMLVNHIPPHVLNKDASNWLNLLPVHRKVVIGARMLFNIPPVLKRISEEVMLLRWDDEKERGHELPVGLGGRLEGDFAESSMGAQHSKL